MNKLKAIQHILSNGDARDMRSTLTAIEGVMSATDGPVMSINVFDDESSAGPLKVRLEIRGDKSRVQPKHINAAFDSLGKYGDKLFGTKCAGCNMTSLQKMFEDVEAELFKNGGA